MNILSCKDAPFCVLGVLNGVFLTNDGDEKYYYEKSKKIGRYFDQL
jgi:hypothetical protein